MTKKILTLTPTLARRLAITRQQLAGVPPTANADGILQLVRALGCVQLDPTSAVERSHWLVLWSRLGGYERPHFERLLWQERQLFEYWAHCASIVLTEDYPIHHLRMRRYSQSEGLWSRRVREWMQQNESLRRHILTRLRRAGPLPARALEAEGIAPQAWVSSGWTSGRNVSRMLDFLWMQGKIMVAGRQGIQKLWDLSERVLPDWTPRERLSEREVTRRAAQRSLRALGIATPKHIQQHFIRGRYADLPTVLAELERTGRVARVQIRDGEQAWRGDWYIHHDDLALLDNLSDGDWHPRTTLLSPFDNLICDRARTEQLFDFRYRVEIYTPKEKRTHGFFVLPILHGDRLIGRVDPTMDRAHKRLNVNAVFAEPHAPMTRPTARAIAQAIEGLAAFLGADDIAYTTHVPDGWRTTLR